MKYVFTGYIYTAEYQDPEAWIDRIKAYTGILEALAQNNEVISIEQINYEGDYVKNGVQYHFKRFDENVWFSKKLHAYIKSQNPDVVFIHSLHFPVQVMQLRKLLGKQVKIIIQNHAEKPFTGIKKYLQRWSDRYTDAYLFASKDMGLDWVKKGNLSDPAKIHEVMEISSVFGPMDKAEAKLKTGVTGDHVFLWVGRLNENKDPLTVVKAFLKFAAINSPAKLYMIYHTEELLAGIKELLEQSAQKEAVVLVGKVPHAGLGYWFNSADIILAASYYEGSGTAVCEAMSCGCMPIVTDIFSFRMITNNGNCGLLFEPGNEEQLSAVLQQTQHMDIAAKQKLALEYFRKNLSFEAIAKRIQEVADGL